MIDTDITEQRVVALSNFLFNYIERYALEPGHVENWSIILDLTGVWATEIPKTKIEPMVNCLMRNFNARMYRFYALDVGFMLRSLWALM